MCASARRIGMHPKPGQPIHFAQVGLTTIVLTLLLNQLWSWIGVKGLVTFVPLWIAFEVVYRAKVRASVVCRQCGFDPVLYLSDVDRTREAVREHWRKRFEERGIPFPEEGIENHALRHRPSALKERSRSASGRTAVGKFAENSEAGWDASDEDRSRE
jgi:hypothetical protein